jgi:hypothetical protein
MYGKMVGAGTRSRKVIETFLATSQNKQGISIHRNNVTAYIHICIETMLGAASFFAAPAPGKRLMRYMCHCRGYLQIFYT